VKVRALVEGGAQWDQGHNGQSQIIKTSETLKLHASMVILSSIIRGANVNFALKTGL